MKVLGVINPILPMNTFMDVIFIDDNLKHYSQCLEDGKIVRFVAIELTNFDIITSKNQIKVTIGSDEVICFIQGNKDLIIGTFNELIPSFIELLFNSDINLFAKLKISSFLSFHGFTSIFIDKCNDSFLKKKIKCTLNKRNFILTEKKNDDDLPDIISKIEKCKLIRNEYPIVEWNDMLSFKGNNILLMEFYFSYDIYKKANEITNISEDIVLSVFKSISSNQEINESSKLTYYDFLFNLFMDSNFSSPEFDNVIFPFAGSNECIIKDYKLENALKSITPNLESSNLDFSEIESFSMAIVDNFKNEYYGK